MAHESSYESGRQPFLPDVKRGQWGNPNDFIYAGLSLAFRIDIFTWYMAINQGVFCYLPIYLVSLAFFIVPFMVIQSFMGQFSSSGFISAFRLSPLFKGIGYVTLALNIFVLAYYSIFAVVPLVYMFASLNPTLPWSCEGLKTWAVDLTEKQQTNLCNINFNNDDNSTNSNTFRNHHIPSVLYFTHLFDHKYFFRYIDLEFSMSWQLMLCCLLVWSLVAWVVYQHFNTQRFGAIIRYSLWIIIGLLLFLLMRFSLLPGVGKAYYDTFVPNWSNFIVSCIVAPIYGISTFGPGWGLFITLSSYNNFKTNIVKSSWIIALGQYGITIFLCLFINLTESYYHEITNGKYFTDLDSIWTLYLFSGSVMAHMEWANMWSVLFFFVIFLASFMLILIQLNSILRTIYDEFSSLRDKKNKVTLYLIGFLTLCSLFFTSSHGTSYLNALAADTFITQAAINLLFVIVILWIYGRKRFQRDIEFMTGHRFSTWMVNILRYVTPLGMLYALMNGSYISFFEHSTSHTSIDLIAILCIALPWICIPGYVAYHLCLGMGPIRIRFLRCCRPTDWFPINMEYRQQYDEAFVIPEINQTFGELRDRENI